MDFSKYFEQYEALAAKVDEIFRRVSDAHPDQVTCKAKCTDCCYALFDVTLIEALYLNRKFYDHFETEAREAIIEKANEADRQIYKLKKAAYQAAKDGQNEEEIVEEMGQKRIRCPLLNEEDLCGLYPYRPLACRIYGVPMAIGGTGRTCGFSGFKPGNNYPTINMDIVQNQLLSISNELAKSINSRHKGLAELLVPASMALLTTYDEEYLGLQPQPAEDDQKEKKADDK